MGNSISTVKYSLEISHIISPDNSSICCSLGEAEYLYTDDDGLYVFKERKKDNPKWLLFQGILKEVVVRSQPLYLMPLMRIDEEKLYERSLVYDNYYSMLQYINNDIGNNMFSMKVISYNNNNNIRNEYLNEVLE